MTSLLRQHLAAIGRSENGTPIGVTVYLHCIENFENLLQSYVGKGAIGLKTQFFVNTL